MDFVGFVNLTRPIIGGKRGIHTYVKTLFESILTDSGKDILDDYKDPTYKSYANGSTSINKISKAMVSYIDPVEFSSFIYETEESVQLELCKKFNPYLPKININNVGDEIAELFANIIREAAAQKRKNPASKKDTGTNDTLELPQEQSADLLSDNFPYTPEDKALLQEFSSDYDEIMIKILSEEFGDTLIDMTMPDRITTLYNSKWKTRADNFFDPKLKSYVFGVLGELNALSGSFTLRNAVFPFSIRKTRERIRNLYVKLHPDLFAGSFPYDAFIDDWNDGEIY